MPLIHSKSKSAFKKNLKEEMKTKPKDQSLAISYSIQRHAGKKMSHGGMPMAMPSKEYHDKPLSRAMGGPIPSVPRSMPEQGQVPPTSDKPMTIHEAIRRKKAELMQLQHFAHGGTVDLQEDNGDEMNSSEPNINHMGLEQYEEPVDSFSYEDEDVSEQEDDDERTLASEIRKRMMNKKFSK